MKNNNWYLYVVGNGSIDAAQGILTNFVTALRDKNLKITNVQVIEGTVYDDLADLAASGGEDGWTIMAMGEGDVATAYSEFPQFLNSFRGADLTITHSGVTEGALRADVLPAGLVGGRR